MLIRKNAVASPVAVGRGWAGKIAIFLLQSFLHLV